LLIQKRLPHYRGLIFDRLNDELDSQLTVATSEVPEVLETGFRVEKISIRKFGPFYLFDGLNKLLTEADIVIAEFNTRYLTLMNSCFRSRTGRKTKWIWWGHGFGKSRISNWIRVWQMKLAAGIIVYGNQAKDRIIESGISSEKVFVATNSQVVQNAGFNPNTIRDRFIFVGRLQARKNIGLLLWAYSKFRKQSSARIGLTIIGDGPCLPELKSLAARLGITDHVDFLGAIDDPERLKAEYDRSLAYVSTGALGLGIVHSFSYGVPVIAFPDIRNGPEFENLIHNENGILCDKNDDENSLNQALQEIAKPQTFQKLSSGSINRFKFHCNSDCMVKGFLNAIQFVNTLNTNAHHVDS